MNKLEKIALTILRGPEKILAFSAKEINLIKAQNISIVLIFLYPLLAITALAFALSGVSVMDISFGESGLAHVSLGVVLPQDNLYLDANAFRAELSSFEYLDIHEYGSKRELSQAIKKGDVAVGVLVTPPEHNQDFIRAKFLYDDSSLFASGTILTQTQTAINAIGFKKSSEILTSLLENIDEINSDLEVQTNKTDSIILQLNKTNQQLFDLNESVHAIDTNELASKFVLFDEYYNQSKADINVTLADINEMKHDLERYRSNAVLVQTQINDNLLPLEIQLGALQSAAQALSEPQRSTLLTIHATLQSSFQEIKLAAHDLGGIITDLDNAQSKLEAAESKLKLASERLDMAKQGISEFSEDFSRISDLIEEAKDLISSTYESKQFVLAELDNAKITLNGLMSTLQGLKQLSPEYVVNPIHLSIEPVYGIDKVTAMVPLSLALILLLTILLLVSSSVIIEREKGIDFRLKSSPTLHATWLSGKIIGQLVFALLEAAIILAVAFFAFNVPLPLNPLDFTLALIAVAFAFICIGLFIPEIMKTQATAILSSLLVLLPMLFLSGLVFPIEFMPQPIDAIASVLPLTVAAKILSAIMLKATTLPELLPDFIILLAPSIVLLAIVLWRNRS
jgi:ABC-type multidrug transport system permease subunit